MIFGGAYRYVSLRELIHWETFPLVSAPFAYVMIGILTAILWLRGDRKDRGKKLEELASFWP